jgi:hypothetical protein
MRAFASLALILLVITPALAAPRHKPVASYKRGQQVPDKQRILQIQQALVDKGYTTIPPSGIWDQQTISALRDIADGMEWQLDNVPDARVLILLGLGSANSDPSVAQKKGSSLDAWQRQEYFKRHPR